MGGSFIMRGGGGMICINICPGIMNYASYEHIMQITKDLNLGLS